MKKSKSTDEQIVKILAEVAKAHQISDQTIYAWRRKFRGMQVQDVGKLRELEREDLELKAMLAESQLEVRAMGRLIQKKRLALLRNAWERKVWWKKDSRFAAPANSWPCLARVGSTSVVRLEADLTEQIANALKSITIPEEVLPMLQVALKDVLDRETGFQVDNLDRLQKQERALKGKLQNLYRDRIEGIISPETYEGLRSEFQNELGTVQAILAGMGKAERNLFANGVTMVELAQDAWRIFLEAEPMDRRNILSQLGWNSPVLDGSVQVSMREPFQSLFKLAQQCGENGLKTASDEEWYSGGDSNPRSPP